MFPRVPDHKPAHAHYSENHFNMNVLPSPWGGGQIKRIDAIILVMVDEDVHGNNKNAECIGGLDFS